MTKQPINQSNTVVIISEIKNISTVQRRLLDAAFADKADRKPRIEKEFGAGFSGARTLLVTFKGYPSQIIKLGNGDLIKREADAYEHVERIASSYIPRQRVYPESGDPNADKYEDELVLIYDEVGDPIHPPVSITEFFQRKYGSETVVQNGRKVAAVLERLVNACAPNWWRDHTLDHEFFYGKEYSHLLPPDFEAVFADSESSAQLDTESADAKPQVITLQNVFVDEVSESQITIFATRGSNEDPRLRIRLENVKDPQRFREKQTLETIHVILTQSRFELLNSVAKAAIPTFEPTGSHFDVSGIEFLNPIVYLSELLTSTRRDTAYRSIIHGDFNLQNILMDPAPNSIMAWLIDFEKTAPNKPTLLDFQRLETEIVTHLLPRELRENNLPQTEIVKLMERLHQSTPPPVAHIPALDDLYQVFAKVRTLAGRYRVNDKHWREYYYGFVIALLGTLKFKNLAPESHAAALITAATVIKLIDRELISDVAPTGYKFVPPTIKTFAGRQSELADYQQQFDETGTAIISGPMGVGKTWLAAKLATEQSTSFYIIWHECFDVKSSVEMLLSIIVEYLEQFDNESNLSMEFEAASDSEKRIQLLEKILSIAYHRNCIICIDNLHYLLEDEQCPTFKERLDRMLEEEELRLIATAQTYIDFSVLDEIEPLAGLNQNDTGKMLSAHDLVFNDDILSELYAVTEGYPKYITLAIGMIRKLNDPDKAIRRLRQAKGGKLKAFISEIGKSLSDDEKLVMKATSVLLGQLGPVEPIEKAVEILELPKRSFAGNSPREVLLQLSLQFLIESTEDDVTDETLYRQHDIVWNFYYSLLKPSQYQAMHEQVGEYFATDGEDSFRAARHYYKAGNHPKTAEYACRNLLSNLDKGYAQLLQEMLADSIRKASEIPNEGEAHFVLARLYTYLGKRNLAEEHLNIADKLTEGQPSLQIQICREMGYLLRTREPEKALEAIRKGLDLWKQGEQDPMVEADLQTQLGYVLIRSNKDGDSEAGKIALQKAIEQAEKSSEPNRIHLLALLNMGHYHYYQNQLAECADLWGQSFKMAEQTHDLFNQLANSTNLAVLNFTLGNWQESERFLNASVTLAEQLRNDIEKIAAQQMQGVLALHRAHVKETLMRLASTDATHLSVQEIQELREEAEALLTSTLTEAADIQENELVIAGHSHLAELYLHRKENDKAKENLDKAIDLATDKKIDYLRPYAHYLNARYCLAKEQYFEAKEQALVAINIANDWGMSLEEGQARRILAQVQAATSSWSEATENFEKCLELLRQSPYETALTQEAQGKSVISHSDEVFGHDLIAKGRQFFDSLIREN